MSLLVGCQVLCHQLRAAAHLGGGVVHVRPYRHEAVGAGPGAEGAQLDRVEGPEPVAGLGREGPMHHAPLVPAVQSLSHQAQQGAALCVVRVPAWVFQNWSGLLQPHASFAMQLLTPAVSDGQLMTMCSRPGLHPCTQVLNLRCKHHLSQACQGGIVLGYCSRTTDVQLWACLAGRVTWGSAGVLLGAMIMSEA